MRSLIVFFLARILAIYPAEILAISPGENPRCPGGAGRDIAERET
jgi:hypothetical protein